MTREAFTLLLDREMAICRRLLDCRDLQIQKELKAELLGLSHSIWLDGNESPFMTRDHQHNPDPNVNAARIVAESTRTEPLITGD